MESDGKISSTLFWSNVTTNGIWNDVLVDACSVADIISSQKWWKVIKIPIKYDSDWSNESRVFSKTVN